MKEYKTEADIPFKLIAIQRAASTGLAGLGMLLDMLVDASPQVANAAASAIHAIVPLAALPERWSDNSDDAAAYESSHPHIAEWITKSSAKWTEYFIEPAVARIRSLSNGDLDLFLDRIALFQGAQRLLHRSMLKHGLRKEARDFSRKVLSLRRMQFPLQVSLSATMACQLRCSFCIAEDAAYAAGPALSREDLHELVNWMSHSGVRRISLTGGEPTLYPWFAELLQKLQSKSIELNIATNGLFSNAICSQIIESRPLCVTMHLAPEIEGSNLKTYINNARSFVAAGVYTVIRCNLPTPHTDFERYIKTAQDTGVREIRMAIPMPNAYRVNRYTEPAEFSGYRELISSFVAEIRKHRIEPRLSKPVPLCLLDQETARVFLGNGSYTTNCPVHFTGFTNNMVIYPDLSYSPCLGLNVKVKKRITDFTSPREAAWEYRKAVQNVMKTTLFEHCTICPLSRGGRCLGACLSYRPNSLAAFS